MTPLPVGADEPTTDDADSPPTARFEAHSRTSSTPNISLPGELWLTVLDSPCTFPPDIFSEVMLNLIRNPNITSSHLFRADILYDSEKDHTAQGDSTGKFQSRMLEQLKGEYRPLPFDLPGYETRRTIVRKLIPRNPQLDQPLVQTCHFMNTSNANEEQNLVVYIPHVRDPESVPFYHPPVSHVALGHLWQANKDGNETTSGTISISYNLFHGTTLTTKLERTALRLLQTIHKHGQGQLAGYEKRVHLDQIIPQKRYQDTYTRLKTKYGKHLAQTWVEVTDPSKHVFEDIAIAAFLIELWRDMYGPPSASRDGTIVANGNCKPPFPGFVDIGCGNGVLVYILLEEGYEGWGFDARERKTWFTFPTNIQQKLQRRVLVPELFYNDELSIADEIWHDGRFSKGTFIISNHADELTAWTPLLAYMNQSAFVAIPCCSHDFTGARFRAPATTKAVNGGATRLPQQATAGAETSDDGVRPVQAAETGSLRRTVAQKKMQSAYSTLCSYVTSIAEEVGFEAEREVLRIPSTRNQCIIGRRRRCDSDEDADVRRQKVVGIVERELKMSVRAAGEAWIEKVQKLVKKPGSGH